MLIEKGANVNERGGLLNNPPIFYAIHKNAVKIVELLIENGANLSINIYAKEYKIETQLVHYAIQKNSKAILKLLLKNGASVNGLDQLGNPPLSDAAYYGNTEAAKLLLEQHAKVNFQNAWTKWTALHYAASQGKSKTAKLLIDHGANVSEKAIYQDDDLMTTQPYLTPLVAATIWGFAGRTATVRVLLENGADPNIKGKYEQTAIHHAAIEDSYGTVELLLKHGANPNITDAFGITAYNIASEKVLELLRQHQR